MAFDPFEDPSQVGILGMASGLMGASGPSRMPVSLGQAMGQGLQRGILDRGQAEQIATQRMLREEQAKKLQQEMVEEQMFQIMLQQLPPQLRPIAMANRQAFGQQMMQQMFPKPKEDFTLGPGHTRFGPDGKPLASVPAEPKETKTVQIKTIGPDGKPVIKFVRPDEAASYPSYESPQGSTNVTLAGSQVIQNKDGTWSLVQPANRPGVPPQITPLPEGAVPQSAVGKPVADKALPVSAAQKMFDNQQNLRRAEQALALLEGKTVEGIGTGDKEATGLWTAAVPDILLNRVDPAGDMTRGAIADLGSLIIHDRSGAAVTVSEYPRLRPFIPLATDKPDTARNKLRRFVTEYRKINQEMTDFFNESGYKVPSGALQPAGVVDTPAPATGGPPPGAVRRKR